MRARGSRTARANRALELPVLRLQLPSAPYIVTHRAVAAAPWRRRRGVARRGAPAHREGRAAGARGGACTARPRGRDRRVPGESEGARDGDGSDRVRAGGRGAAARAEALRRPVRPRGTRGRPGRRGAPGRARSRPLDGRPRPHRGTGSDEEGWACGGPEGGAHRAPAARRAEADRRRRLGKTPALHQLQENPLAEPAAGDPQWQAEQVRDRFEYQDAGGQQAHALGVELEALGHLGDRRGREHADPALERLVLELGAHQPAQRGGGAPDRDGALGRRRREPLEGSLHMPAQLLELVHRGRVRAQIGVGEEAGADPERLRPGHLPIRFADGDLARAAAHVDHRDRAAGRLEQRARGPDEGQPSLLLAREDAQLHASRRLHRVHELVSVASGADRRGCHGDDVLGAHLPCNGGLGAHDLGGLRDLVRRNHASVLEALAYSRERALGHQLTQPAVARIGHQQPRRVAADVDAGADQAVGGASSGCEASSNSRNRPVTTKAVCSPMSTALSPTRSMLRPTSIMCMAHSRWSGSSPSSSAWWKTSLLRRSISASWRTRSCAIATSRRSNAWPHWTTCWRAWMPIRWMRSSMRESTGGSCPARGTSLAMLTHWSPIRSTCLITCSSAATTRRSDATGACSASSERIPCWTSRYRPSIRSSSWMTIDASSMS